MENENIKSYSLQLDDFENNVILNKLADIDLDSDSNFGLYDTIIKSFIDGDFDTIYNSKAFNGLSNEEKSELLKKGKLYINLCFSKGGTSNWYEYCSKNFYEDSRMCLINILRNFDNLLTILRYGGEDSLRMISSFVDDKILEDGSMFDKLNEYFPNNAVLTQAMIELGQPTNNFSRYSNKYKKLLCENADGVLYIRENNLYSFRSPYSIALDVTRIINGKIITDYFDYDKYHELISDESLFIDALFSLSVEKGSKVDLNSDFIK